jgi:3-deoxy-D-manno-octulosonate 8-phosphate phosphatase (KDO 8-P phosphatase)
MNIPETFTAIGGQFISTPDQIVKKLEGIKAFIFDWDGVFNNGQKSGGGSSDFNEIDSMGTNLLRYSYFLKHKKLPLTAVISGERNETAFYFCRRECFDFSFFKTPHKTDALTFICEKENIEPHEVAYFFDDVLDLSIAEVCGVRILVGRKANPLFTDYCIRNKFVDYITASEGGNFAVREASELLIGLSGEYNRVINDRTHYAEDYKHYITQRRLVKTQFFTVKDNVVEAVNLESS